MKSYDNPSCRTIDQFKEDMDIFGSLNKICIKNDPENTVKLLNVIVMLLNVFHNEDAVKMMFYRTNEEHWWKLKTVLTFLNVMPSNVIYTKEVKSKFEGINIIDSEIPICPNMIETLRNI